MTPKEKAEELVSKFEESLFGYNVLFDEDYVKCINCALIAVDEILNEMSEYADFFDCTITFEKCDYWQEVKKEIEKL